MQGEARYERQSPISVMSGIAAIVLMAGPLKTGVDSDPVFA
jgi:hypothetical protein